MWGYPYTMILVQIYFFITALIVFKYARKSKNYPEKKDNPSIYFTECAIAFYFLLMSIILPWIFNRYIPDINIRHQCFFHLADSLTVQFLAWAVYVFFAKKNNKKNNINITFEEWKEFIVKRHQEKSELWMDIKRKLFHLIPPGVIIFGYIIGIYFDGVQMGGETWDRYSITVYVVVGLGFLFLYILLIFDLLRLNKFENLGNFSLKMARDSVIPKELNTFTSSNAMVLSFIPFIFADFRVLITVVLISAVSDAAASLTGKKWGKRRNPNDLKTIEGYVGGFVATFIVVILTNYGLNYSEPLIDTYIIYLMAIGASIGFFLVDKYVRKITDNIMNPLVTGTIMWIIFASLT